MDTLSLRNVSFFYPEQSQAALNDISLQVKKGAFLVLCGSSGCGKSTLLRQLKPALTPHGVQRGTLLFEGTPLQEMSPRDQAEKIAFVSQSPENQIVTDKVWHEMAFGAESLGLDTPTIRKRVAETASFFGIEHWFYQKTDALSGGQKQLLTLASAMVMRPEILILDEPTAQLDPIAASEFLAQLAKINRLLGTTVILSEHRLEEVFGYATEAAVLEKGKLLCCDTPRNVGAYLKEHQSGLFLAMPAAMRLWAGLQSDQPCPLTTAQGAEFLRTYAKTHPPVFRDPSPVLSDPTVILQADEIRFRYERPLPDVLKDFSVQLHKGEFLALLGGNGVGKSTALGILAGVLQPCDGTVKKDGVTALLPQNPQTLFVKKSVREDLFDAVCAAKEEKEKQVASVASLCEIRSLLDRHPYDLSGGEQQRAALAKVLLTQPDILLLDEPTKGLDAEFKSIFAEILYRLLARGIGIIMVSHDIEFCALYAHRCGLVFDGAIVSEGTPHEFFCDNRFYTTAAARIAHDICPKAVTTDDILLAFGGTPQQKPLLKESFSPLPEIPKSAPTWKPRPLPLWRKISALVCAAIAIGLLIYVTQNTDLTKLIRADGITSSAKTQLLIYAVLLLSLFGLVLSVGRRSAPPANLQTPLEKRRLSLRTRIATLMILLLIPLTLFFGIFYLDDRSYTLISFLILAECMLPFFLIFEKRKPKVRELVVIAVLCAMGVAGRAAFFMLPQFKPVMALTIIAGVALGGESGFIVGAITMLASNMLFSQGPWTPWQMFCMGIIGFLAGVLFRKGWLRRERISLSVFGALSALIVYGGIINPASVLMFSPASFNFKSVLASYVSGFPMDLIHAAATAFFLMVAAEPMLDKLERIKVKYGLIE